MHLKVLNKFFPMVGMRFVICPSKKAIVMIKFSELKVGNYVMVDFEGRMWDGEVTDLNNDEKQICIETEVQEFWYEPEHIYPIPINDEQLMQLNFTREVMDDGSVKYRKGAFRVLIPEKDNFSRIEIW